MARVKPLPFLLLLVPALAACAGRPAGGPAAPSPADPWAGLATPRTSPLPGAPRISIGEISAPPSWAGATGRASLGLQELVAAGMLRRADVQYVERRRFDALAQLERRGLPRPEGAPPLGTTPGAELVLLGSALALADSTWLDLRLVDPGSSETRAAWRLAAPASSDPPGLARAVTGSLLAALARIRDLPGWEDPLPGAALPAYSPSGIPDAAWRAFLAGVSAEDRYDWDGARSSYQRALQLGGPHFFEAEAALARAARLRAGGTLGAG